MKKFEQQPEQARSSLLSEVPAIKNSRNEMVRTKKQLKDIVEQPLLDACKGLWDKNIKTLSSSANKKDLKEGEVYIIIDFDSLSDENQELAQQYAEAEDYDGGRAVKILIPISDATSVDEISQKAIEIAATFKKQPATWIPKYKLEDLKKAYGVAPSEIEYNDPSIWKDYYYDSKEKIFYLSEEHYKKANEKNNIK